MDCHLPFELEGQIHRLARLFRFVARLAEQPREVAVICRLHALALRGHGTVFVGIGKREGVATHIDHVVAAILLIGEDPVACKVARIAMRLAAEIAGKRFHGIDCLDVAQKGHHAPKARRIARVHIQHGTVETLGERAFGARRGKVGVGQHILHLGFDFAHAFPERRLAAIAGLDDRVFQPFPVHCCMEVVLQAHAFIGQHALHVHVGPRQAVQRLMILILKHDSAPFFPLPGDIAISRQVCPITARAIKRPRRCVGQT